MKTKIALIALVVGLAGCATTPPVVTEESRRRSERMSEIQRSAHVAARVDYYVRQGLSYQEARNLAESQAGLRTSGAIGLPHD